MVTPRETQPGPSSCAMSMSILCWHVCPDSNEPGKPSTTMAHKDRQDTPSRNPPDDRQNTQQSDKCLCVVVLISWEG